MLQMTIEECQEELAKNDFDWQPNITKEEGLLKMIKWVENSNFIKIKLILNTTLIL